jgi:putative redox protein
MTPPELLRASLASCAGFYAAQYLRKFKLGTEATQLRVTADKIEEPVARIDNFRIEIETPVELTEQQQAGVERAVHHCLIHNTLQHPVKIAIGIRQPAAAAK